MTRFSFILALFSCLLITPVQSQGRWPHTTNPSEGGLDLIFGTTIESFERLTFHRIPDEEIPWEGKRVLYYPNGTVKETGCFINGYAHGTFQYFHEDGSIIMIAQYDRGCRIGLWSYYSENRWIYSVDKDVLKEYHQPDVKMRPLSYQSGKYAAYHDNGNRYMVTVLTSGYVNGKFSVYFPDGKLYIKGQAKMGKPVGKIRYYDGYGKLWKRATYYKDGTPRSFKNYDFDSRKVMKKTKWDENGEIIFDVDYHPNGKPHLTYRIVTEQGQLKRVREEFDDRGILVNYEVVILN